MPCAARAPSPSVAACPAMHPPLQQTRNRFSPHDTACTIRQGPLGVNHNAQTAVSMWLNPLSMSPATVLAEKEVAMKPASTQSICQFCYYLLISRIETGHTGGTRWNIHAAMPAISAVRQNGMQNSRIQKWTGHCVNVEGHLDSFQACIPSPGVGPAGCPEP